MRDTLEQAESECREIGKLLGGIMPKGWGFTLILSSLNDSPGFCTYISNCNRQDIIKMLRETADRLEEGEA